MLDNGSQTRFKPRSKSWIVHSCVRMYLFGARRTFPLIPASLGRLAPGRNEEGVHQGDSFLIEGWPLNYWGPEVSFPDRRALVQHGLDFNSLSVVPTNRLGQRVIVGSRRFPSRGVAFTPDSDSVV
jgi:hypothetical protein